MTDVGDRGLRDVGSSFGPAPAGGWEWITALAVPVKHTVFGVQWRGEFRAVCPHGQMSQWNAFTFAPLCECT